MLTVAPPAGPPPTRIVHLDVDDITLRLALTLVAEDAGWRRGAAERAAVVVSDQLHAVMQRAPVDVLVVAPRPAHCQAGMRAVATGRASVLLSADDPEQLPAALEAAAAGYVLVPRRLVDAANEAPALDERLVRTLLLVTSGASNTVIARALHQSESTAKRDVATLIRLLSASSRGELADAARRLGYLREATP